jgi:hypothetical protein
MKASREAEDRMICAVLKQRAGVSVESVFDLVNARGSYPEAISILLAFLPTIKDNWIKEGVVRALTVKEARGKAELPLVEEFQSITPGDTQQQSLKWAIGNALNVVATKAVGDELLALVNDRQHGPARQMIVVALSRLRPPKFIAALIDLLNDDDVCGHAIIALRKSKAHEAIPFIEALRTHSNVWIRKEAKKAVLSLRAIESNPGMTP